MALTPFTIHAQTTQDYKQAIAKYEGVRLNMYKDSEGYKTIGIGHKLTDNESFTSISLNQCNDLFTVDLNRSITIARRVFPSFDTQPAQVKIILVNLVFQLGEGGINKFKKFKLHINNSSYKLAGNELIDSKLYKQARGRIDSYVAILQGV